MAIRLSRRKIASHVADRMMAGAQTDRLVLELAALIVDAKRTNEVELIVRDLEYELSQRGIVLARVSSAFDLAADTRLAVIELVQDKTGATQVQLQQSLDPDLLGGVKIDLPGQRYDATIARQLATLRTNYKI